MKVFHCPQCAAVAFFENVRCETCNTTLGYQPENHRLLALECQGGDPASAEAVWAPVGRGGRVSASRRYRRCRNQVDHGACNWLVAADAASDFCEACRLNQVVPDLTQPQHVDQWRRLEAAKRRLVYSLHRLGLPVESAADNGPGKLAFRFLHDTPTQKVVTGHHDGRITLNVAEADSAFRENTREKLGEAYRTVLGHFRHEVGHYYWDQLVRDSSWLRPFRERFGDERASYQAALERHYDQGPPDNWREAYISAYATMHPWEDWAETWAHYLHMVDTLETAASHGVVVSALTADGEEVRTASRKVDFEQFDEVIAAWYPVTLALNSLSRSMGQKDLYPFAVSDSVLRKLRFVHAVVRGEDPRSQA